MVRGRRRGARTLVELGARGGAAAALARRPIVLAPRRPGAAVAEAVAPRARELGVMLPYTPLHHLLLADAGVPLVMTSGNVSDEPIAFEDEDALRAAGRDRRPVPPARPADPHAHRRLGRARVGRRAGPLTLRRSRGYVPRGIALPGPRRRRSSPAAPSSRARSASPRARAPGSRTTSATCATPRRCGLRGRGRALRAAVRRSRPRSSPTTCTRSTSRRSTRSSARRRATSACSTTTRTSRRAWPNTASRGPAIGAIFDGTGYGTDGAVWGGELLVGDLGGFERAGHLRPVRMPGGEQAIRQPWRMACAWLQEALGEEPAPLRRRRSRALARRRLAGARRARRAADHEHGPAVRRRRRPLRDPARGHLRGPGRDRARGRRRARRPRPLRAAARPGSCSTPGRSCWRWRADLRAGTDPGVVAARFHDTVAAATAEACAAAASARGLGTAVLSGGVFPTAACSRARRRGCARRGCACSCPSVCRRATAAWPTGRRRSPPRGRRRARAQRGTRGERNVRVRIP